MKLARLLAVLVGAAALAVPAAASAQLPSTTDPRANLAPGFENPGTASLGMQHLANRPKPAGFVPPDGNPGNFGFLTSDMAFQGDYAFVGGFNGFQIWNIRNPTAPSLTTAVVCPGGQGDLSVYRNLLFMSVEETRARVNCSLDTTQPQFRGVRIFDISDIRNPEQVAAVQTCRGSHTHTLVTDEDDRRNVYIYVSGTSNTVRTDAQLAGCDGNSSNTPTGTNPTKWRIEVIKVPVRSPEDAAIVNEPRLFANDAGAVNGLQNAPPAPEHPCATATPTVPGCVVNPANPGSTWSPAPVTDACHDITVYPEIELAAGACEGNGLLIDISDPANPKRIDAVADPNYAYWHGATFSNDGKHVVFTDEWGGGVNPRCRATDDLKWGGNSIYAIRKGKLKFRSYYKLPVAQTPQENCVSHIPSLIPVPGRDIFVQAWYQGGASLVDFSDPSEPVEIGYFDRGPVNGSSLVFGGFWSTYWYNGETYGSELARNFDVMGLKPTADLSANEIKAAREVEVHRLNVQRQDEFTWKPSFAVVRSFFDQAVRSGDLRGKKQWEVDDAIDDAERYADRRKYRDAAEELEDAERELKGSSRYAELRDALDDLADEFNGKGGKHGHGHGHHR
jgi:hypothetical protein